MNTASDLFELSFAFRNGDTTQTAPDLEVSSLGFESRMVDSGKIVYTPPRPEGVKFDEEGMGEKEAVPSPSTDEMDAKAREEGMMRGNIAGGVVGGFFGLLLLGGLGILYWRKRRAQTPATPPHVQKKVIVDKERNLDFEERGGAKTGFSNTASGQQQKGLVGTDITNKNAQIAVSGKTGGNGDANGRASLSWLKESIGVVKSSTQKDPGSAARKDPKSSQQTLKLASDIVIAAGGPLRNTPYPKGPVPTDRGYPPSSPYASPPRLNSPPLPGHGSPPIPLLGQGDSPLPLPVNRVDGSHRPVPPQRPGMGGPRLQPLGRF